MAGKELPRFLTHPDPEIYRSNNYVVLDFETTTIDKGTALDPRNSIVLAVWSLGPDHPGHTGRVRDNSYHVRWSGEYGLDDLVEHVRSADYLIAHNSKFELQWLERCGLDLSNVLVFCTMIGEYVIGGNRWNNHQVSLENCARRRYGEGKVSIISKLYKAGLCSTEIPASWLEDYCIRDVELTERLFLDQREEMTELGLLPVMYTRCLATPVLADIEKNGMQVDADLVRTRLADVEREFAQQQNLLEEMTGGINLNSVLQLGAYVYDTLGFDELRVKQRGKWVLHRTPPSDRFPEGQRKVDVQTMALLKPRTKAQREFLKQFKRYKELYNELTKYLRKFADCAEHDGGVLHARFNQTNTQTHRLSSTGTKYSTQFQNFPRAYKPLFRARRKGWLVGECDGAQLEFRVATHLGRDRVALQDILDGVDVHTRTADIIEVTRQDAKAHTFKPLYGGTSGTTKEQEYYKYFQDRYDGITQTQQRWINDVLHSKCLVTEWGMRYYWPNTRRQQSGYVTNTTSICNYPVQGFATAEIIPISLVFFWHRLKRSSLRMFIVNTIHDSIICELPEEEVEEFHRLSEQCLIDDVYPYLEKVYDVHLTVPLGAGVKVAGHWGTGEETVYQAKEELYE